MVSKTALWCCGCVGPLVGAILLVVGGCLWLIASPLVTDLIVSENFVQSKDSPYYPSWESTWVADLDPPSPPQYELFWLYNLTNVDEVVAGGKPSMVELGPWTYRVNHTKIAVTFAEDGLSAQYKQKKTYYFEPAMSPLPEDVIITNVNPAYVGAVWSAGSEEAVAIALIGPVIDDIVGKIESAYIPLLLAENADLEYWYGICGAAGSVCESERDLALFQWGHFNCTGRQVGLKGDAVHDVVGGELFPAEAEWGAFHMSKCALPDRRPMPFNVADLRKFLYGPMGMKTDPANLEALLMWEGTDEELYATFGIQADQVTHFVTYMVGQREAYSQPFFESIVVGQQAGLYISISAHNWLWNYPDPLLLVLQPKAPNANLFLNDTSDEFAFDRQGFWEQRTGYANVSEVDEMTMWRGYTEISTWFSNYTVKVSGNSGWGQFVPNALNGRGKTPDMLADILAWSPDHGRAIVFRDEGVRLSLYFDEFVSHRMALINETYDVDPRYDISNERFMGFVNATLINGAPIYYCQPRMLLVSSEWTDKIDGMPAADWENCGSFIWIEPVTGLAVQSAVRLQVNVYLPDYIRFKSYPDVQVDIMMPIAFTSQEGVISEAYAEELRVELYAYLDIVRYMWIFATLGGGLLMVACLLSFAVLRARGQPLRSEYTAIQAYD